MINLFQFLALLVFTESTNDSALRSAISEKQQNHIFPYVSFESSDITAKNHTNDYPVAKGLHGTHHVNKIISTTQLAEAYHNLSTFIRNMSDASSAFDDFFNHIKLLKLDEYVNSNQMDELEIIGFIEKIIYELAANKLLHKNGICLKITIPLVHSINIKWIDHKKHPQLQLMLYLMQVFNSDKPRNYDSDAVTKEVEDLTKMFQFAKDEIAKSSVKYNRYTNFSFLYMDYMLSSMTDPCDDCIYLITKLELWNSIRHVEFIDDYLQRNKLIIDHFSAQKAIKLIINDIFQPKSSLKLKRFYLFKKQPKLLFNCWEIIDCIKDLNVPANDHRINKLFGKFVQNGLISWNEIHKLSQALWTKKKCLLANNLKIYANINKGNTFNSVQNTSSSLIISDVVKNMVPYLNKYDLHKLMSFHSGFNKRFYQLQPRMKPLMKPYYDLHVYLSSLFSKSKSYEWAFKIPELCGSLKLARFHDQYETKLIETLLVDILTNKNLDTHMIRGTVTEIFLENLNIKDKARYCYSMSILVKIIEKTELNHVNFKFEKDIFRKHNLLLKELVTFATQEIFITRCNKNRYVKSTLFYIDWLITEIQQVDIYFGNDSQYFINTNYHDCVQLLDDILRIPFIDDILVSNSLKQRFISLVIDDYFKQPQSGRLMLLQKRSLFDFDVIVDSVLKAKYFSIWKIQILFQQIEEFGFISVKQMTKNVELKCRISTGNELHRLNTIRRYLYVSNIQMNLANMNPLSPKSEFDPIIGL